MIKTFLVKTGLVLFSTTFTLGAFDLAVYLVPRQFLPDRLRDVVFIMERDTYYVKDPHLGNMMKPGIDYVFPGEEFNFRVQTRLNYPNAGFRGGTLDGPVWGAAFGDSFTFGAGVDIEGTWVARLARLARHEILNFGVPGHGPHQYTRIFKKYGAPLGPQIVFFGFFSNDLKDAVRFESPPASRQRKMTVKRFLKRYSASYNMLSNLSRSLRIRRTTDSLDGLGVKLADRRLRDPYGMPDEKFASAWAASARQIDDAIAESKRINAVFVLLYFPQKEEVYWELAKERIKNIDVFRERIGRLRNSILSYCAAREVFCLDLTPALKNQVLRGEQLYYPVDIHWNENGHVLVAQEIYQFLLDKQLVDRVGPNAALRHQE